MLTSRRSTLLLLLAGLVAAPTASAETTTRVSELAAADVSANGRYVLLEDGTVLDRVAGTRLASPAADAVVTDLASDSARVLYRVGDTWFVRDLATPAAAPVAINLDPAGVPVKAFGGQLIRNGQAVAFTTDETPRRILTIGVGDAQSALVLANAGLIRASDDGKVIAFSRTLTATRPAGKWGLGAKPSLDGQLVGYVVAGSAPRVVGIPAWRERLGAPNGFVECSKNDASYDRTTTSLTLAQDGLAGGRYLLPSETRTDYRWGVPSGGNNSSTTSWQDPYSAAATSIVNSHGSYPLYNGWTVSTGTSAPSAGAPLIPPAGSTDPSGLATVLLAFNGGGGGVLTAQPRAGGPVGTFVTDGTPVASEDISGWTSLPRESDPLLTGDEQLDVTWAPCEDPVPTPTPEPTYAEFSYSLQGTTAINTLTKGSMPLTGRIDAKLDTATGNYAATTTLNDTQGRLTALGFLPVTVAVGIVPSGQTTGTLNDDQLTANLKARIKVKSVKAFGVIPLAGGNSCQSKSLSDIALKSTTSFDPTSTGGTIGGSYAISDLNGCGVLNGLVSPLTAGPGNTITAKLTPIVK